MRSAILTSLLTLTLISNPAAAQGECTEVVEACDNLVKEYSLQVTKQQKYIEFLERRNAELMINLDKELKRESAWFKNPAIIVPTSILLGLVVGGKIL